MSDNTKALVAGLVKRNPNEAATNADALNIARNLNEVDDTGSAAQSQLNAINPSAGVLEGTTLNGAYVNPASSADGIKALFGAKATYDFSTEGGDVGTIPTGIMIPANAIILYAITNVATPPESATNTGELSLLAGATVICGPVLADGNADAFIAGLPIFTAATVSQNTLQQELNFDIAVEDITAGKVTFLLIYMVSE